MQISPLPIDGAFTIVPNVYEDERGLFKETFASTRYRRAGILDSFVQDNISFSHRGVLRGMHSDPKMAKLVQVLSGSAFDVIADLRPASPTYLQWCSVTLRGIEHTQAYIPRGCLHGFLSLEASTVFSYKQSSEYDPDGEFGIAWNDPDLKIAWPLGGAAPILSPKDAANPTLREHGLL